MTDDRWDGELVRVSGVYLIDTGQRWLLWGGPMAEMFKEIVRPSARVGAQRWYTVPLSIVAHAALIVVLIVVPLFATGALPTPISMLVFTAPSPPAPPERPRAPAVAQPAPASTAVTPPSGPPTEASSSIQPETPSFSIAVAGAA